MSSCYKHTLHSFCDEVHSTTTLYNNTLFHKTLIKWAYSCNSMKTFIHDNTYWNFEKYCELHQSLVKHVHISVHMRTHNALPCKYYPKRPSIASTRQLFNATMGASKVLKSSYLMIAWCPWLKTSRHKPCIIHNHQIRAF